MGLATDQSTITTAANFIPEKWGPAVVAATESKLVLRKLTWDWAEGGEQKGDTVHAPAVSNFTATAKTANTEVALSVNTEDVTNLSINRHDQCSFLIEDIVKAQESFNISSRFTKKAGFAVARLMDTRIVNLIPSLTQIVGSAGTDLGDQEIRSAIEFLDIGDVDDDDRHFVMYPTQKNAIWGIEKYFRADIRGDGASPVVNGKFGQIYGINTYVTTNLTTSGTPAARLNVMFQREAFASVIQMAPRTQAQYILEHLGTLVVVDSIYGEALARNGFAVWMKS